MSRVFVLGAGASREYKFLKDFSVPLDGDFWGTAGCIIAKGGIGPQTEKGGYLNFEEIVNNLKKWYKIKELQDLNKYGLERVFSDLEERHPSHLSDFKRLLEWILFQIIRTVDENKAPTHYAFVKNMLQPEDSIITFNYDFIIDRTIEDIAQKDGSHIKWHPSSGYGLPFSSYINRLSREFLPLKYAASDVIIYKLHGSLGWIVSEDGTFTLYTTSNDNKVQLAQKGHLAGSFFIVPPLQNKQFPEWIKKLWVDAEDRLMRADQVFCIGYSFPKTDSKAISMFKRACKDKSVNIILPKIDQKERSQERIRLCEIFDNKPHFVPATFSQWVTSSSAF